MTTPTLPCWAWIKGYNKGYFASDLMAAVIVTIMLIPQSLAYALLAGLPPEMGLYASILPLVGYALLGTSSTLSVGPVAVVSLMTATAVGQVAASGLVDYATAAVSLAFLSGLFLCVLGLLKFGFIANFLSHPVVSGFITASGIIIALSQLRHILGIQAHGETLPALVASLAADLGSINHHTLAIGLGTLAFLYACRQHLSPLLQRAGLSNFSAETIARAAPVMAIAATTWIAFSAELGSNGVALVGDIPRGLPAFSMPLISVALIEQLAVPALLISLIGFVESVSVGRTLGAKRRERVDANQELIGLGAANVAAAISNGFPVTGGFSRSVVNFDAGARTQAASIMTALGIAIAALLLTPALYFLPKATLAATIIIAVTSLIDWKSVGEAWRFAYPDFIAITATIIATLLLGVEIGVLAGVTSSVGIHLFNTMRPHFAIVGTVPGTEHYRNVDRHDVITHSNVLSIRIDESLYFANAAFIEELVYTQLEEQPGVEHVVLMCPAINSIDLSALEALEEINQRLREQQVALHLSEVKGPVMDVLKRSHFLDRLAGQVFLQHHEAVQHLAREPQ